MEEKKESIRTSTWVIVGIAVIFILGYLCYQSETIASIVSVIVLVLIIAIPAWMLFRAIVRIMHKDYEKYRIEEEKLENEKGFQEEKPVSKKDIKKIHKTYTTSRLSSKNVLFPSTITLTDFGVIIIDPYFYAGKETTTPYTKISAVKVRRPLIGFSDVILDIMGADQLRIHGFTASDANEIKSEILNRIK